MKIWKRKFLKRILQLNTQRDEEVFDENAGVFPSEDTRMEVDQEEVKEESTSHFLSREIGEDSSCIVLTIR